MTRRRRHTRQLRFILGTTATAILIAVAVSGVLADLIPDDGHEAPPAPTQAPTVEAAAESALLPGVTFTEYDIVDGDTIAVWVEGKRTRVRIIGINTPELARGEQSAECYAVEATELLTSVTAGQPVTLVADMTQSDRDRYDRLLRHVYVTEQPDEPDVMRSVAVTLLAAGAAREYTYDTPYVSHDVHVAAEQAARASNAGLWGACQ